MEKPIDPEFLNRDDYRLDQKEYEVLVEFSDYLASMVSNVMLTNGGLITHDIATKSIASVSLSAMIVDGVKAGKSKEEITKVLDDHFDWLSDLSARYLDLELKYPERRGR